MRIGLQAYVADSKEAVALYQRAFGVEVGFHELNPDGTYLHVELDKDGQGVIALSESSEWSVGGMNMQFAVNFGKDDRAALQKAYEALSEGGRVLYPLGPCPWNQCMADVVDRFGVRWYIAL